MFFDFHLMKESILHLPKATNCTCGFTPELLTVSDSLTLMLMTSVRTFVCHLRMCTCSQTAAVETGRRPQLDDPSPIRLRVNPRSVEDGGGERKSLKRSTEEPITALQGRRLPGVWIPAGEKSTIWDILHVYT